MNVKFEEMGNGFPQIGENVIVDLNFGNFEVKRVAKVSSIHTIQWKNNYVYLDLVDSDVDWDDCSEQEQDKLMDSLYVVPANTPD